MQPEELKALRTHLGLTQEKLAEKIGTRKTQICQWERGKHRISKAYVILLNHLL